MITLIIVLAFSQTASYMAAEPEVNTVDVQTSPSSDWLISHTQGGVVFLSDFSTSQMTRYYFSSVDREVTQRFYSSEAFSQIVTGDNQMTIAEFGGSGKPKKSRSHVVCPRCLVSRLTFLSRQVLFSREACAYSPSLIKEEAIPNTFLLRR